MNRADWLALAAEYDAEAQKYRTSGNDDSARIWQQYSRAARDAARQAEQEQRPNMNLSKDATT